jgi:replicative superfamily II helicase
MYKKTAFGKHRNLMTTHYHAPQFKGTEIHINDGSKLPVIKKKKEVVKLTKIERVQKKNAKKHQLAVIRSISHIKRNALDVAAKSMKEKMQKDYEEQMNNLGRPTVEEIKKNKTD